jgi:hypothetical protein
MTILGEQPDKDHSRTARRFTDQRVVEPTGGYGSKPRLGPGGSRSSIVSRKSAVRCIKRPGDGLAHERMTQNSLPSGSCIVIQSSRSA